MKLVLVLLVGVVFWVGFVAVPAAEATGGEGEAWPSFNESSACGAHYIRTPHVERTGRLAGDTLLRGPFAEMFGRTVDQVRRSLVGWQIPGSSETLLIHERFLPALELASRTIEARLQRGDDYRISPATTYSVNARTVAGSTRISRHTFGTAMDINSAANPFRESNRFVSDLPDWWVQAFLDAGLCWGGAWVRSKDPMHFSWQGPAFTAGSDLAPAYPPLTEAVPFGPKATTIRVVPEALPGTIDTVLADVDGNGVDDVVRLSPLGADLVVDVSTARNRHNACSLRRSVVPDFPGASRSSVATGFGDWDGRGGQDLWTLTDDRGFLRLTVRWAQTGYTAETAAMTPIPTPGKVAWATTGDFDADGSLDLYLVADGHLEIWAVDADRGDGRRLTSTTLPLRWSPAATMMLGDRDGDLRPDLWLLDGDRLRVVTADSGYQDVLVDDRLANLPTSIVDGSADDYDGDGRTDVVVFDGSSKHVWLGNSRLEDGAPLGGWFEADEPECGDEERHWDEVGIRFGSGARVRSGAVQWLERNGFDAPCDPGNDGRHCPDRVATSADFVVFMAWVLDSDPGPGGPVIAAARAVEDAGHAVPCPMQDEACWNRPLQRTELANLFGRFLAARWGSGPEPHRWVPPSFAVPSGLPGPAL